MDYLDSMQPRHKVVQKLIQVCASSCAGQGYSFFGHTTAEERCWCMDEDTGEASLSYESNERMCEPCGSSDLECKKSKKRFTSVFHITSEVPETVVIYIAPAKRTSSMFNTGRFDKFLSGRFAYRRKPLNAVLFKSEEKFKNMFCTKKKKIFVQVVGAVVYLLNHWSYTISIFVDIIN